MVGHARLACDEAGHWLGGLARVEQVGWREEVKVTASENRTLSESVRASCKRMLFLAQKQRPGGLGVLFIYFLMSTAVGELRAIQAATRARTSLRQASL